MELTKRQEEILLSLIRREIINQELCVGGSLDILASADYLAELLALRSTFREKK